MKYFRLLSLAICALISIVALNVTSVSAETLKIGSEGTAVKRLQMNLNGLAYARLEADGIYDEDDFLAVKKFQTANGLTADGIAGDKTLNKISEIVKGVQKDLKDLGYSVGAIDGIYGNGTKNAVISFQRENNLSVDGIAGTYTGNTLKNVKNNENNVNISSYANTASNVVTYSKKEEGEAYLSRNFKVKEFACVDGSDKVLIDEKLVALLQDIREHFGKPVRINSAYRTYKYNQSVGGGSKSNHLYGKAADIKIDGVTPLEIARYAEKLGVKGIGLYNTFVHVDTRTVKYYWNNIGNQVYSFR